MKRIEDREGNLWNLKTIHSDGTQTRNRLKTIQHKTAYLFIFVDLVFSVWLKIEDYLIRWGPHMKVRINLRHFFSLFLSLSVCNWPTHFQWLQFPPPDQSQHWLDFEKFETTIILCITIELINTDSHISLRQKIEADSLKQPVIATLKWVVTLGMHLIQVPKPDSS